MWVNAPRYKLLLPFFFFFFGSLPGAKGVCLCDMLLHGVGTWLAPLGKKTEQVAKRRKQGRASACCEHAAGVLVACDGKRLKKQPLHTFKDTNKHNYIGDIPQEDPIWLCVFVVVFAIVAESRFFMVAGLSVGAVKHSGVFSCDWDSLEEESVRHGAWLSACWSSGGGRGGIRAAEEAARAQSTLPLHPARSILSFHSPLTHSPCCSLLHPLSFLSSISQRGFISCDSLKPIISSPPTSIPSEPLDNNTQPLDQSPKRAGSLIDAYQRIHCCWPVLPIPVIMCAAIIASLSSYCTVLCC